MEILITHISYAHCAFFRYLRAERLRTAFYFMFCQVEDVLIVTVTLNKDNCKGHK